MYQSAWYSSQPSHDRYDTYAPALWSEIEHLERKLKHRSEELLQKDREIRNLKRRHEKLKSDYRVVFDAYDRTMDALKEERRRWRRVM